MSGLTHTGRHLREALHKVEIRSNLCVRVYFHPIKAYKLDGLTTSGVASSSQFYDLQLMKHLHLQLLLIVRTVKMPVRLCVSVRICV